MFRVFAVAAFALSVALTTPASLKAGPQEKHEDEAKPAEHEQKAAAPQKAQPAQHTQPGQRVQPAEHAQKAAPVQHAQPAEKAQAPQHAQRTAPVQHGAPAQRVQRASNSGRIPDTKFRASFGRAHTFHVDRSQMVGGSPRFQYGGFWFGMAAPWPVGWQYTDDVYVDYINGGYFLCNPRYPGVLVSVNVTL